MANCNLVHVVFDRSAQNPEEDAAIFTMHVRGTLTGLPDSLVSMTPGSRDAWSARFDNFLDTWKTLASPKVKCVALKWYDLGASADDDMGPPVQVHVKNKAGVASGQVLPPQLAMSATLKHPSTGGVGRHGARWGRIYIPGITVDALDANGRFTSAACQVMGDAVRYIFQPAGTPTGCRSTIWSRTAWSHFDPNVVQVDDVPDVIRSRRFSTTNYRYRVNV